MPTVSKYHKQKEWFDFKVEHYKKQGLSNDQIAHNLGIAKQTFYEYLKKYKDFSDAYKKGKVEIVEQLENATFKKALGYEYEEITQEVRTDESGNIIDKHIKKIKKHVPPDTTALIFLLTNLLNKKYKRNPDLNVSEEGRDEDIVID